MKAMRRRIALPERIAQYTSPRVFHFAEAFGVRARPRLPFHQLVRVLTDETILSKLFNQARSWPARERHVLTYAS